MEMPVDWLLAGPAWVEYRARLDLLGQVEGDPPVQAARAAMLADPQVAGLAGGLLDWPGAVIASHKSAGQSFHRLAFLADLGLRAGDLQLDQVIERILAHPSAEGPFQLPMNISASYGGSGQEQWAWALCDAPLQGFALARFGLGALPAVQKAAAHLAGLVTDAGWPCAVSKELGKFRGPGKKGDPCPYANLAMLRLLSEFPEWRDGPACRLGAEAQLGLWAESRERHPYMFFMGDDFRKLKAPFIWYDLMHVLEVLSRFSWLKSDPRLGAMRDVLKSKIDGQGRFTVESLWTAWKDWEFGQKKQPSRWLTLCAWRILNRF